MDWNTIINEMDNVHAKVYKALLAIIEKGGLVTSVDLETQEG